MADSAKTQDTFSASAALAYASLVAGHSWRKAALPRTPEPSMLTDDAQHVQQYDHVRASRLALAYAAGLAVIHRARTDANGEAIDLACGPGHFTLWLAEYLRYSSITGIDLSQPMLATAARNSIERGFADRVRFQLGDIADLPSISSASMDLVTCTDAAHHLPNLASVRRTLQEMERVAKPDGLIVVMDLARLKTAKLTDRYVQTVGRDYEARGLNSFLQDFRNSMFAAWSPAELHTAIPAGSQRVWRQIVARGLPTLQFVLGLPVGRRAVFVRRGFPWTQRNHPVPKEFRWEWRMLWPSVAFGSRH